MGVAKRPDGMWRARVEVGGKQKAKHFTTKRDAVRWEAEQKTLLAKDQWVDVSDKTTVADYARQWVAARPHRPTTARRMTGMVENHIAATRLGSRRLSSVRPSEVQAWASDRAAVLSPSSLRNVVSLLRSIYASAVLDRLVAASPVVRVALPRHDRERIVPLTPEQVQALALAMPERNYAMVITQAGLGLRIGELLALRVQDVDFLRRSVRIEYQFAPQSKIRTDPKTPKSRRTLPLPTVVAEALAAHIERHPPLEDGTLFVTRQRSAYRHDHYGTTLFKAAVAKAGLPEGTTSHDLRHFYASHLLAAGESVVTVAERLGHENASLVISTYGHVVQGSEERTRRAIDALFATVVTPGAVSQERD